MVESSKIREIVLNPAFCTKDDFRAVENRGVPVRWMEEDESSDKNIFVLEVEE